MNKFSLRPIGITVLLFCARQGAQAQVGRAKITGRVMNESHASVSYEAVTLVSAKDSATVIKGTLTGDDGSYIFSYIGKGTYFLAVAPAGQKRTLNGPVIINDTTTIVKEEDINITTIRSLSEVVIVSKKPLIEQQTDKTVVNVENSSLAAGNSVMDVLQRSPGVTIDDQGNISMKGKAGVTVMIDGRLTYLSGDQLASLLKSMQANSVQAIELITNPSSKYDAAGSAGIINIRTLKNRIYGFNGNVTIGAGYGKNFRDNTSIALNYKQEKVNLFFNYSYDDSKLSRFLQIDRTNKADNTLTYFDETTQALMHSENNTYKAGMDYNINDNNVIGVMVNGYMDNGNNQTANTTLVSNNINPVDTNVVANNPTTNKFQYTALNLNYHSKLDSLGQELSADVDYAYYNNDVKTVYNNYFYDQSNDETLKAPDIFRNNTPTIVKIFSAKVDYTHPFSKKTKLDAGLKTSYVRTDNNIVYENLINNSWVNDTTQSNQFRYTENINAAYVNLNTSTDFMDIQAGLRAEQTNSEGNSITTNNIVDRHYLDLFPSLFLRKKLSDNNTIVFSYSRRVDRPNYATLNPFVYNFDLYTLNKGNPYLNPQFTNSISFSYNYKSALYVSLSYSRTNDAITEVTLPDTVNKTLYVTQQNLANEQNYSLNISYPLSITSWWTTYNNANIYYNKFSTPNLLGEPYSVGRAAYDFNTNQTFTVNSTTNVDLSFTYLSPRIYGTYFINSMYWLDLGVKKSFAQKRLVVKASADDLFNWHHENIHTVIPGQDYRIYQKFETRIFRLSINYRFGSTQVQGARDHTKGSSDEENRVKH